MYNSPKAIHFTAVNLDGVKTASLDRDGLRARWRAAELCQQRGVKDMLRLNDADRTIIEQCCIDASDDFTNVVFAG